jgi:hypothetical protein
MPAKFFSLVQYFVSKASNLPLMLLGVPKILPLE